MQVQSKLLQIGDFELGSSLRVPRREATHLEMRRCRQIRAAPASASAVRADFDAGCCHDLKGRRQKGDEVVGKSIKGSTLFRWRTRGWRKILIVLGDPRRRGFSIAGVLMGTGECE